MTTPHPLLAPFRPASYRELPRVRRPVALGGAILVLGVLPVTAALRHEPRPTAPAALAAAAHAPVPSYPVRSRGAVSDAAAERAHLRPALASARSAVLADAPRASRSTARPPARPMRTRTVQRVVFEQRGRASWYGPGFHGRRTASGERFDTGDMTAAHKTLPFGSKARVCTKRSCVTVRINDRGPFVRGRVVDLSRAAARALGIEGSGTARVTVTVLRTTTVREPVPAAPATPVARPAARIVRPAAAPSAVASPALALAGSDRSSTAGGDVAAVSVVASMVLLMWAAPAVATRRRREGLDFTR